MPKQKDLKRLVRTRMRKTGESYTAARLQLIRKRTSAASAAPTAPDLAEIAGLSNESVKKATGCTWERWVKALDRDGGSQMSHRDLAAHIRSTYKTPSWWTQMVAVGYERIRGLRLRGQQLTGDWTVSKSKTFAAPLARLYSAFETEAERRKWLGDTELTVRTARPGKSIRLKWTDGSPVEILFTSRGPEKSQAAVEHRKISSKAEAERIRAFWTEHLGILASMLT